MMNDLNNMKTIFWLSFIKNSEKKTQHFYLTLTRLGAMPITLTKHWLLMARVVYIGKRVEGHRQIRSLCNITNIQT